MNGFQHIFTLFDIPCMSLTFLNHVALRVLFKDSCLKRRNLLLRDNQARLSRRYLAPAEIEAAPLQIWSPIPFHFHGGAKHYICYYMDQILVCQISPDTERLQTPTPPSIRYVHVHVSSMMFNDFNGQWATVHGVHLILGCWLRRQVSLVQDFITTLTTEVRFIGPFDSFFVR